MRYQSLPDWLSPAGRNCERDLISVPDAVDLKGTDPTSQGACPGVLCDQTSLADEDLARPTYFDLAIEWEYSEYRARVSQLVQIEKLR